MYQLTVMAAHAYARRALDELVSVEDTNMLTSNLTSADPVSLRKLVEGFMVEAVLKTYASAPAIILDGAWGQEGEDYTLELNNGVVTISMETPVYRILSVKCSDSDYVLGDMIPENSAEGRKQLNAYIRGTYDDPRLVLLERWNGDNKPRMKYYSTTETDVKKVGFEIEFLPYPELVESVVEIAPRTEYAVLNQIVALVLDSFREPDLADRFRAKAKEHLEG